MNAIYLRLRTHLKSIVPGAGKTTLMDVLSLRKHSGEITGEICLNGFPQDPDSFR